MDIGELLVTVADACESDRVTAAASQVEKPAFPASFTRTQKVLAGMLRENTGASILDSGGAYGRSWQRNLVKPFWEEPRTTLEFRQYDGKVEIGVTHNVFHWLSDKLTYNRSMTKALRKLGEREGLSGMRLAERFPEWLAEKGAEVGGIYGEGGPQVVNTYNGEDCLSQTLQYVYFTLCDGQYGRRRSYVEGEHVVLQIHGGADVRGGYTEPVVFDVDDELAIFDNARASICPDYHEVKAKKAKIDADPQLAIESVVVRPDYKHGLNHLLAKHESWVQKEHVPTNVVWDTDNGGCDWRFEGEGTGKDLEEYSGREIADRSEWTRGTIGILPDGSALCPITGCKLVGGYF